MTESVDEKDHEKQETSDTDIDEIKVLWRNFLQALTLHGFRQVFERGPKIRRVLWLIILIVALFMVCVQSRRSIKKYFDRPVTTNVQVEFVEEIIFPAVTICNFNLFPFYLINGTVGEKVSKLNFL